MKRKPLTDKDGEVRELTRADFRHARPMREVLPELAALYRRSRGRPQGRSKEIVNLSLDIDLVQAMRDSGRGWQTRANAILRKGLKLPPPAKSAASQPRPRAH